MVEQRKRQIRRSGGRFYGFRINCEEVPMLPASAVRWVWDDPRRIPYLLVWKSRRDGEIKRAVRVARSVSHTTLHEAESVEIKWTDGGTVRVYLSWRWQPHGGRSLLLRCWRCQRTCRSLYGARIGNDGRYYVVWRADWECRQCAGLSYSSEDGYLRGSGRGAIAAIFGAYGPLPRPEPWYLYVFTSPEEAAEAGVCAVNP